MKLAAILALFVSIMLGAWATNDYRINEEVRRDFVRQGISSVDFRNDAGELMRLNVRGMTAYDERRDVQVGSLSVAFLVASGVLFSRRKRSG